MPLRIPESDKQAIAKLAELQPHALEELLRAMREQKPHLLGNDLVNDLAESISSIPSTEVASLVDVIMTLHLVRASMDESADDFAEDVVASEDLPLDEAARVQLKSVLVPILNVEPFVVTAKAVDVLTEHQNAFHGTRIVTDARPIYVDDPKDPPSAAVIVHMLKIVYHSDRQLKDFFVGLDSQDLQALKKAIGRAEDKEKSLRARLVSGGISVLEPEAE